MSRPDDPFLADVLRGALEQDREVRLVKDDDYGFHIKIEGVRITESDRFGEGMPWETWDVPLEDMWITDDAREKSREILEEAASEEA